MPESSGGPGTIIADWTPAAASHEQTPVQAHPALLDLLHRLHYGIVVTAAERRPSFINIYAQRVLDRCDGLAVTDTGLEAARPQETRLLREAIGRAARRQLMNCVTLILSRREAARPLAVHVPAARYGGEDRNEATLVIADPTIQPAIDPASLSRLYGLTKAEANLTVLLVQGHTVDEAAGLLFTSVHTARTHLKRILLKTDTGRQAELLRLILLSSPHLILD